MSRSVKPLKLNGDDRDATGREVAIPETVNTVGTKAFEYCATVTKDLEERSWIASPIYCPDCALVLLAE